MQRSYNYGPIYWIYAGMKNRCYNHNNPKYKDYGGRGIKVCDRWLGRIVGFANFVEDMGERPEGYQIDRKDNDGDYTPENCRWVTIAENCAHNRRRIRKDNKSGVSGVFWNDSMQKYQVWIGKGKKRTYLGSFDSKTSAIAARKKAEKI